MFVKFKAGYVISDDPDAGTSNGRSVKEKYIYVDPRAVIGLRSCSIYLKDEYGEEYEAHGTEINAGDHDFDVPYPVEVVLEMLRLPTNARRVV